MKVYEAKLGEVINIKNASENPCIKTASSVIDRWGSNWSLAECGDLECTISKAHVTKAAYREFMLQVRSGQVYIRNVGMKMKYCPNCGAKVVQNG